jgi:hypothetical protein
MFPIRVGYTAHRHKSACLSLERHGLRRRRSVQGGLAYRVRT